jgi:hypothetical protein
MKQARVFIWLPMGFLLLGCIAGRLDYTRPKNPQESQNFKIINKPREVVWNTTIPALSKQFFAINNLDKSSGLINVSYSGDPERYIDCGRISSYVRNFAGERTFDFAGARAQEMYQVMKRGGLFYVERKMSLEGRINLVFEETAVNQSKITANTRYVITRLMTVQKAGENFPQSRTDTITFDFGGRASFPTTGDGQATECVSTGKLEEEILAFIK